MTPTQRREIEGVIERHEWLVQHTTVGPALGEAIKALWASHERMREALEHYANPASWLPTTHESTHDGQDLTDYEVIKIEPGVVRQVAGKRARAALTPLVPGKGAENA